MTPFPLRLLPRRCPVCGDQTIVGHGLRRKQAHDLQHDWIRIRRGRCGPCRKTSWEESVPDINQRAGPAAGSLYSTPMGRAALLQGTPAGEHFPPAHHPCLGLERDPLHSAGGGEQLVNRKASGELKQRIPLLDYLQAHGWQPARSIHGGRLMGCVLCTPIRSLK